jgi:hypothetical protein
MAPRLHHDLCAAALHHTARLRPLRPDRPRSDFVATATPVSFVRRHYLWYVAAALAVMIVAITSRHLWLLNFVHVLCSLLWTGIIASTAVRMTRFIRAPRQHAAALIGAW